MRVPHIGVMPKGGVRHYMSAPRLGTWSEEDKRYILVHERKSYKVARLVAEAFHGPPPFERAVVMHLDENSRNNKPENLAWGTQRENMNAPKFKAWQRMRVGENSTHAKARRKREEASR
jgi:hypothetical protein